MPQILAEHFEEVAGQVDVGLARLVQRGRLTPRVGAVRPLAETRDAFLRKRGIPGKTIIEIA